MHDQQTDGKYRIYVLCVLTFTYLFSYMDRQILSILIEDIGREFSLDDAQRGMLMGLAFALFYAGLGIPVARLADRMNRKRIIAGAITFWSAATILCGAATGFWSLFVARVAVGVGEAGASPPAHSMIGDYFGKHELTRALSVYSLGTIFGGVIGLIAGGILSEMFNWRVAFVVVGLPGILLGLIVLFTLKEPTRGRLDEDYEESAPAETISQTLVSLFSNMPYVGALISHTLAVLMGYVIVSWSAAIFGRSFEIPTSQIGLYLGLAILFGGLPGMLIGGDLTDRLGRQDARWMGWVPAIANAIAMPAFIATMLVPSALWMSVGLAVGVFFYNVGFAPALGIVQSVVKPGQRALASAFVFFFANLFGLGAGPTVAGWLSDRLRPTYGNLSLNYAVMIMSCFLLLAAIGFVWTAHTLKGVSLIKGKQH